ncbi:AraC family transcriptional regulator [Zooshikella ganghwensis]|uniref:AraC family transcriptional regulator n=1 Tax=Zooshikella ganghwensis TaxID=202772 RepID=UPI0004014F0E|nr:AraC family transcriptional regulator [Zooshikella ganghwensis]
MHAVEVMSLPQQSKRHQHSFHQLVVGLEGTTEFEIAGKGSWVDSGKGCLVPSDCSHYFCGCGENRIWVVNIPLNGSSSHISPEIVERLFNQPGYFELDPELRQLIHVAAREVQRFPHNTVLAQHLAVSFMLAVGERIQSIANVKTCVGPLVKYNSELGINASNSKLPNAPLDFCRLESYVERHLHQKISIIQLARQACLSPSHFHAVFKAQSGLTPHQYVTQLRIQRAKALLTTTSLSLIDIAQQAGFSSQSALTHALKQKTGQTPGQLRKWSHGACPSM